MNYFSFSKISFAMLSLLILHACTLYPRYDRPCAEMPEHWRVESNEADTVVNIRWWEQFEDTILNDLIEEALESNQDLRIATARVRQFWAQMGIVNSQSYPQISAQATVTRQRASQTLGGDSAFLPDDNGGDDVIPCAGFLPDFSQLFPIYSNDYLAVLNASYELDLWGRIRSATNAAYADLLAQVNVRRTMILSVVSSVAIAYIQLRQYDRQLHISLQTLNSRQNSLKLAQIRFEEGLTSELEVKQATAERDEAALQVIQFKTLIPQHENLLSALMGHPPKAIERGLEVDGWQLPPEVPTGLPGDLLEQRPDIMQAENALIAANFRIGEARALFLPDMTLTGYYGYESTQLYELFTNPSKTWQWMVNVIQPIFTGWRLTSGLELAEAQKEEAMYRYLQVILTALKEVNDALITHRNTKEALKVQQARVQDLRGYLELATLQYQNGLVDYLNVLDAERRLFDAQLELAKNQADLFLTLVTLYKALGGGWVVDAENLMKEEWSQQNEAEWKCQDEEEAFLIEE